MTADRQRAIAHIARASAGYSLTAQDKIQEYKKALKYEPGNRQAQYGLAVALYMIGKEDSALAMWKELSKNQDMYGKLAVKWLANVPASSHSSRARTWIEYMRRAFHRQTNQSRKP